MVKNIDYIIPPVDKELIKKELNKDTFVRKTNKGNNEIYIVNYQNSPNVLREIGRLRELTFATSGGGTGKEVDLDEYDISENSYDQLIVYSPEDREIASGYRFIDCSKILKGDSDDVELSTRHYFNFSKKFIQEYLPYTIELGRSWVQPNFQPTVDPRKGIFALDNLWDGLGALVVDHPHIQYFFGKVTMYTNYDEQARDAILHFMKYYFPDKDNLVTPIHPLNPNNELEEFRADLTGKDFNEGFKVLQKFARERGEGVPPLISNYMQLSPTMKSFGTAINPDFGGVEETGIMIKIDDVYEKKKDRHVNTYIKS